MLEAHLLRTEHGDYTIVPIHLADAIERLVTRSQRTLSEDRAPKDPYAGVQSAEVNEPDE